MIVHFCSELIHMNFQSIHSWNSNWVRLPVLPENLWKFWNIWVNLTQLFWHFNMHHILFISNIMYNRICIDKYIFGHGLLHLFMKFLVFKISGIIFESKYLSNTPVTSSIALYVNFPPIFTSSQISGGPHHHHHNNHLFWKHSFLPC